MADVIDPEIRYQLHVMPRDVAAAPWPLPTDRTRSIGSRRALSVFREGEGGIPRIVATGMWSRSEQETRRKLHEWDQPIHRVRGRIEKIFGTWKRSYGLRRMRWQGLTKAAAQAHLTAIAYNLKRTMNILTAAA
jgi:hypothetical protein